MKSMVCADFRFGFKERWVVSTFILDLERERERNGLYPLLIWNWREGGEEKNDIPS